MYSKKFFLKYLFATCSFALVLCLASCSCKHEYGEWTVAKAATCAEEGLLTRNCTKCNEPEEAPLPMSAHSFGNWETTMQSTCVAAGTQKRSCSVCGANEESGIALAEHTFGDWVVATEATCTSTGTESSTCSLCHITETRNTDFADHVYTWTTTKSATCTTSGTRTGTCSMCGKVQDAEIVATGHNWASATCIKPKTCKTCGEVSGSIGGHSWNPATCSSAQTCSNCGISDGSALGHNYGSSGTCNNCGKKMVSITLKIPSIGAENAYASLVVTNYTDSTLSFPKMLSINGKLCNSDNGYQVGAGKSATLSYYRAIIPSQRYDKKNYDMYLDNNSIGYCVITWNGTQYYAEYGVSGLTTFYRGNVNGPA